METCPWVVVQMQTGSLGSGSCSCVPESMFLSMYMTVSPFPLVDSPPTSAPASSVSKEYPTLAPLYEWSIWVHGSNLNKNYLSGEKFADLRFKLLIVKFFLFFLLLFICVWNMLSEIHHNLAVVLFCGDIVDGLGISKQGVVVSHSWQVTPYGTSGFGDGAMSVLLSSHVLFLVCWLKSDSLLLFYLFF